MTRPEGPTSLAHAWAGLDYGHTSSDVGLEDLRGVLPQLPNGTCNQIARRGRACVESFVPPGPRPFGTKIGSASSAKNAQGAPGSDWLPQGSESLDLLLARVGPSSGNPEVSYGSNACCDLRATALRAQNPTSRRTLLQEGDAGGV
jgi:hypothetical protein